MANTIRISPHVHARLKRLAKKLGMNPHPLASEIIDAYIKGGLFVPPTLNKPKSSEEVVS
jgi:predicted transcriptional regulator